MSKVVVETAGWIRGESDVVTVEVAMVYETSDPYAVRLGRLYELAAGLEQRRVG